ncbi:hypothetical protein K431DRAFT_167981 [Polychaeton citri CBS 116435]|uniref:Uncharacterized protein n=1 Tax=Polychaeton citri CBS 116435 TaxID=1314669 RepID=A0A9P4UKQ0_9PEZI|nr:hypothetical protein K431DRAFT_167981 [Polychaeton citri CBS 116435]
MKRAKPSLLLLLLLLLHPPLSQGRGREAPPSNARDVPFHSIGCQLTVPYPSQTHMCVPCAYACEPIRPSRPFPSHHQSLMIVRPCVECSRRGGRESEKCRCYIISSSSATFGRGVVCVCVCVCVCNLSLEARSRPVVAVCFWHPCLHAVPHLAAAAHVTDLPAQKDRQDRQRDLFPTASLRLACEKNPEPLPTPSPGQFACPPLVLQQRRRPITTWQIEMYARGQVGRQRAGRRPYFSLTSSPQAKKKSGVCILIYGQ